MGSPAEITRDALSRSKNSTYLVSRVRAQIVSRVVDTFRA